jgi:hypothetical protein
MSSPALRILRLTWLPWIALFYILVLATFAATGWAWSTEILVSPRLFGRAAFHAALQLQLFLAVALLFPLGIGVALAQAFQEAFHRPFGMLLPSARRRMATGHIALTFVVAAAVAGAAYWVQPDASWPALFGFAVGAMSLSVPLEPGMRWQGSRLTFFVLCGILIFSSFHAWQLRTLLMGNAWIADSAGLGVAAVCFNLGYSRERLRARAMMPRTTLFSALGSREAWARWLKERRFNQAWPPGRDGSDLPPVPADGSIRSRVRLAWRSARARRGSGLPLAVADGSTWSWVRLARYECYGSGHMGERVQFLSPLITFSVFLVVGYLLAKFVPPFAPYHHLSAARQLVAKRENDLRQVAQMLVGAMGGFIFSLRLPKFIYPVSRRGRFRILTVWLAAQELLLLVTVLCAVSGFIFGRNLEDHNQAGPDAFVVTVILVWALILIPGALWAGLYRSRGQMRRAGVLYFLSWCGLVATPLLSKVSWLPTVFSPVGLVLTAALIVILHAIYWQRVRSICLKADLVLRS